MLLFTEHILKATKLKQKCIMTKTVCPHLIMFTVTGTNVESCWHIISAIKKGAPSILTYCKSQKKTKANRRHSTSHIPTVEGCDRDEYPFACTYEGGFGANVMHINSSDNRRAGAFIGNQLRGLPDGTKFIIVITY